jgi:hypothetical protein
MFCLLISIAMFACVEPLESGHKIWAAIFRASAITQKRP